MVNCRKCGKEQGVAISLHKFPNDPVRRRAWEQYVGPDFEATDSSRLCSEEFPAHFVVEKFTKTGKPFIALKPDAVPDPFAGFTGESPVQVVLEGHSSKKYQRLASKAWGGDLLAMSSATPCVVITCNGLPFVAENDIKMDQEFYSNLKEYLKTNKIPDSVPASRKNLLVSRAKHYRLENGEVMYGEKTVIVNMEERKRLLGSVHVIPRSGEHVNAQKMFQDLRNHFYWRTMYVDIVQYIGCCKVCKSKNATNEPEPEKEQGHMIDDELTITDVMGPCFTPRDSLSKTQTSPTFTDQLDCSLYVQSPSPTQTDHAIWEMVELKLMKVIGTVPNFMVSLADPASRWFDVKCLPVQNIVENALDFLCNHFAIFGFARFNLVGFSDEERQLFSRRFEDRYLNLTEKVWPFDSVSDQELCPWVQLLLNTFDTNNLQKELIKYRNKANEHINYLTPNSQMLKNPKPYLGNTVEETEPTPLISCFVSDQASTSMPEEEEIIIFGPQKNPLFSTIGRGQKKNLQFITLDQKRAITVYAQKHGEEEAAYNFSKLMGQSISITTVHNICTKYKQLSGRPRETNQDNKGVKRPLEPDAETGVRPKRVNQYHSPELRAQISQYAFEHGCHAAIDHFKATMNLTLNMGTVRSLRNKLTNRKPRLQELQEQLQELNKNTAKQPPPVIKVVQLEN